MQASLTSLVTTVLLLTGTAYAAEAERVDVVLETELGSVVLAIDIGRAPRAAHYFLGYVDSGQYDGATLYRSASLDGEPTPQLVQGGLLAPALNSAQSIDPSDYGVSSLLSEWETTAESGLRHRRGSVSLARDLLDTGHVIPELVFSLRDIPAMDAGGSWRPDAQGFPIIGEVVSGMDVIDMASQAERQGATNISFLQGQILSTAVPISRSYRRQVPAPKRYNDKQ